MNSKNSYKEIEELFNAPPTTRQKAWGLINKFYHLALTRMKEEGISRTQLAEQLNRSKSSVSQMFNKTPNISVVKMVEIADAIGFDLDIVDLEKQKKLEQHKEKDRVVVIHHLKLENAFDVASQQFSTNDDVFISIKSDKKLKLQERYDC